MEYSHENTVLVWLDDKNILELVKKVCHSLKLDIYELEVETDLYGIPFFFAIVDGRKLTKDILNNLSEIMENEKPKEFAVMLTQPVSSKIPFPVKRLFIKPIEVINFDWIKTNLFNKRFALLRHKNNDRKYDRTILRVVYIILELRKKNGILYMDEACRTLNVTERTIKRDIALLRGLGEDIEFDRNKKGYVLAFSTLDLVIGK